MLWDAVDNCRRARFEASKRPITGLAFNTDGRSLATWGRDDDSTKIWDLEATAKESVSQAEEAFKRAQAKLEVKNTEVEAIREKVEWTRKMREKGYVSARSSPRRSTVSFQPCPNSRRPRVSWLPRQTDSRRPGPTSHVSTPSRRDQTTPGGRRVCTTSDRAGKGAAEAGTVGQGVRVGRSAPAQAGLENVVAKSDSTTKEVAQMEKLLDQRAIGQEIFEEARPSLR